MAWLSGAVAEKAETLWGGGRGRRHGRGKAVAAVGNMRAVGALHKHRGFTLPRARLRLGHGSPPARPLSLPPERTPGPMRRLLLLLVAAPLALAHPARGAAQAADSAFLRPGDVVRLAVFR